MGQHAKLSPSAAKRWLTCTKSVEECDGLPNPSSPYAAEGTLAHELLELRLKGDGTLAPELILDVPADMLPAVSAAYKYVQSLLADDPNAVMFVEVKVGPGILGPDVSGTADVVVYQPLFKILHVIDYKHGVGVAVDVEGNPQLEIYAILALEALAFMIGEVKEVYTTVIQPRAVHGDGAVRSATYPWLVLAERAKEINWAVEKIASGDTCYMPGEDACRWCLAKATCKALKTQCLEAAQMTFLAIPEKDEAKDTGADELVNFFANRKLIDMWLTALDRKIKDELAAGRKVGDLKLVAGRKGNRAWAEKDEKKLKEFLKSELKLKPKEMVVEKLKSVTQIGKVLDTKGTRNMAKKREAFDKMVTRADGKPVVAAGSDKRDAIVLFEDLTKEKQV